MGSDRMPLILTHTEGESYMTMIFKRERVMTLRALTIAFYVYTKPWVGQEILATNVHMDLAKKIFMK